MIDINTLAAQLGFETDEVAMLIEMFLETAQESMEVLHAAIALEDFDAIQKSAHSIKGSAANLTLEPIYLKARELEALAKEKTPADYTLLCDELDEMLKSIQLTEVI